MNEELNDQLRTLVWLTAVSCDECGALSIFPATAAFFVGDIVSRCGLVYDKDDGAEPCTGNAIIIGYLYVPGAPE